MPKTPINYQKSVIYKICCKDISITDCYVGSTTNLNKRKPQHKSACKNEGGKQYNQNVYRFIRENGGFENLDMIVVEDFPCDSKNQLHTRERFHIEVLHANLNKVIPTRTKKEYQKEYDKDNAEHIKAYRKDNAEHIRAYQSEKIPCPHCNKILSRCSMTVHIKLKHTE